MSSPPLHPFLQPIAWLDGSWLTSEGHGQYPTIKPFHYCEKLQFKSIGQPMYIYSSDSWHPETLAPMHLERGFLRINPKSNGISLLISHNFGVTSLEEGVYTDSKEISLKSTQISRMEFAKDPAVRTLQRTLKLLDQDTLEVVTLMETENTQLTEHLRAIYKRQ